LNSLTFSEVPAVADASSSTVEGGIGDAAALLLLRLPINDAATRAPNATCNADPDETQLAKSTKQARRSVCAFMINDDVGLGRYFVDDGDN